MAAVPSWSARLNDRGLGHLGDQFAVLAAGAILYAGASWLAHRRAVATFARVDL